MHRRDSSCKSINLMQPTNRIGQLVHKIVVQLLEALSSCWVQYWTRRTRVHGISAKICCEALVCLFNWRQNWNLMLSRSLNVMKFSFTSVITSSAILSFSMPHGFTTSIFSIEILIETLYDERWPVTRRLAIISPLGGSSSIVLFVSY